MISKSAEPCSLDTLHDRRCIVEIMDRLMYLCDALEERNEKRKEWQGKFLEAVVGGVVSG